MKYWFDNIRARVVARCVLTETLANVAEPVPKERLLTTRTAVLS